ncbi:MULTISPECIES: hypothetical protein [Bacillus]|uniref:S-layer protein EA1 n=1 Tax=Bacillus cereus (strain ATCC 10987 / NRS 248) TaxID=222523 RepID=Q73CU1_BACC1|nr:S-layer protein EA1 [Bacillus cereus ATCC 10987]KMQ27299.1 hypothetical protein TU53_27875 [Bacillus cereus]KXY79721.1 hypothetical protein AT272_21750 [Bacillus cereus]OBZ59950.1 hypothetical protein UN66_05570 [Bacillus cereus]OJE16542.1 hypothetical protein BAQ45_23145 [Bacillus pacificus]
MNVTEGNVAFKNFELVSKVGQYGASPDTKLDLTVSNTVAYQLSKYTDKGTLVFKVLGDKNVVTSEIGSQAVQVNVLNNPNL